MARLAMGKKALVALGIGLLVFVTAALFAKGQLYGTGDRVAAGVPPAASGAAVGGESGKESGAASSGESGQAGSRTNGPDNASAATSPEQLVSAFKNGDVADVAALQRALALPATAFKRATAPFRLERIDEGETTLLTVSDAGRNYWQLLLFRKTDAGWRFVGPLDYANSQEGRQPAYRFVGDGRPQGKSWFVVASAVGSGAGYSRSEEVWYDLGGERIREALRYPVEESRTAIDVPNVANTPPFVTRIVGKMEPAAVSGGPFAVDVRFDVAYTNGLTKEVPEAAELFRLKSTLRYAYNEAAGVFRLDADRSDRRDWNFAVWPDELLRQQPEQLLAIATGDDDAKKRWLKLLLDRLIQSPQKTALLDKLQS